VNLLPASSRLVLRRALVRAIGPVAAAGAIAWLGAATTLTFGEPAPATLAPWLHLPAFTAAAVCGHAALEAWPAFAQRRPGADWMLRLRSDPWFGCGGAALGSLLALALLLLPIGMATAVVAPMPHSHRALTPATVPILDAERSSIDYPAEGHECRQLRLRPFAFLPPTTPVPTTLEVLADGAPLTETPLAIAGTRELLPIAFPPRAIRSLTIRRTAGNLPLLFADDAVVAIDAAPRNRWLNGLYAAAWHLLPLATALAIAMLLAPFAALPTITLLFGAALLVQTLGALTPAGEAFTLALRGHWLASEPLLARALPSSTIGMVALALAAVVRKRLGR
jgi:hypothetical protein